MNQAKQKFLQLAQIAASKGLVKNPQPSIFRLINLALFPYVSTSQFYNHLTETVRVWQKLTFSASQDEKFLQKMAKQMEKMDPWGSFIGKIYNSTNTNKQNSIIFQRYDFITDQHQSPKIIQYNFTAVGLSLFTKIIQQSHRVYYPLESKQILEAKAFDKFIDTIYQHYQIRNLKGKFIMILGNNDWRFFIDHAYNESKLKNYGIKVERVRIQQLESSAKLDLDNNLYYQQQLVSFVYFRHGYNLNHYDMIPLQAATNLKIMLATSNATCIPNINYQIVNTKRVQCELSKPQIMRKYLTEDEAKILQESLVQNCQFNNMDQSEFQQIVGRIKQNPNDWVLKPNRQGGSNNLFGQKIIDFLSGKSLEQMKQYIYQKKISSPIYQNYIITEECKLQLTKCFYELGRFGIVSSIGGNNKFDYDCGYSAFTHEKSHDEAYHTLSGAKDGFTSWKIRKQQ